MNYLDDLPERHHSHVVEDEALSAFQACILKSEAFILQSADKKDYGVDCQIEVVNQGNATNVRIYVQLKGTERPLNADGSISVEIARTNFNYLLMQPYSFYVCFHVPTNSLRICLVEDVLRQYEHGKKKWIDQKTLTVSLDEELTPEKLKILASLSKSGAAMSRNRRAEQVASSSIKIPELLKKQIPDLHIPARREEAVKALATLYEHGSDEIISAVFDRFAAVIGIDTEDFGYCYMAEINIGLSKCGASLDRIENGIEFFRSKLDDGRFQRGSLYYTIGNAWSALGNEEEARKSYESALMDQAFMSEPKIAAQVYKNLGSSIERLNNQELAVGYYHDALQSNPELPEAHHALANYYIKVGRYQEALDHLDRVVFTERELGTAASVAGWRVNVLFNLGDGRGAFREINSLLSQANDVPWIWSWCATQVASFGRISNENARQAIGFWQRFLVSHPNDPEATRELLLAKFYLRANGEDLKHNYVDFKKFFERMIQSIANEDILALLWDRLGHWAQDEDNWVEAEKCFRISFKLKGGHYGYCLGTALNFLGRYHDALPILIEQAKSIQPDAMSWFQVAVAQEKTGKIKEAIISYQRALKIDPNYDLALFNLGGLYWNSRKIVEAIETWNYAIELFPDHKLAIDVKCMLSALLSGKINTGDTSSDL